jgi:hypothetical protein
MKEKKKKTEEKKKVIIKKGFYPNRKKKKKKKKKLWNISGYDLATAGRRGAFRVGFTVAQGAFARRVPVCIIAVAASPPTGVCDDPTSRFHDRG